MVHSGQVHRCAEAHPTPHQTGFSCAEPHQAHQTGKKP
ncbi:hypothetical protein OIU76_016410, partial [Salix suchowensis]